MSFVKVVEIFGLVSGILYIFLSMIKNRWLWIFGGISSASYIYVFFISKFYADMALQVYYLAMSVYGWILWNDGAVEDNNFKIRLLDVGLSVKLGGITLVLWLIIALILRDFTDSPVPVWDAFTTALSITATWMLAKKYIEQWLLWIVVDLVSAGLYIYKGLYPTVLLYLIYSVLAVGGYFLWRKKLKFERQN